MAEAEGGPSDLAKERQDRKTVVDGADNGRRTLWRPVKRPSAALTVSPAG